MKTEFIGLVVGLTIIASTITTCAVKNSGPCTYGNGDIVYRKLDGVRGIIVLDTGCHMSHRYSVKFTNSYYEHDITEYELQRTPELVK